MGADAGLGPSHHPIMIAIALTILALGIAVVSYIKWRRRVRRKMIFDFLI